MGWIQRQIRLQARPRGFHIITHEIVAQMPELRELTVGLAHIFIQHTSAALTINENVEPEVRADMETHFNRQVPDGPRGYTHNYEGPDDMPAHIKASLLGSSVTVPIRDGKLALGTWQGIYLCEHRNHGGARRVVVTLQGQIAG